MLGIRQLFTRATPPEPRLNVEDFFDLSKDKRYLEVFLKDPKDIDKKKRIFQTVYKDQLINSSGEVISETIINTFLKFRFR